MRKPDPRPICNCHKYTFPHKIGGRCWGEAFVEYYHLNVREECRFCNCNNDEECDVYLGKGPITKGECYVAALHYAPGEHLVLEFTLEDYPE